MPERKAIIKSADMPEDMQQEAADCSGEALDKFNIEKDIAAYIKKEFDRTHGPTWHCVVGRQFGRTLRGSRSTGMRSTWPSQRNLCSVISSFIEGETLKEQLLLSGSVEDLEDDVYAQVYPNKPIEKAMKSTGGAFCGRGDIFN
ncbi:Dynein light chain LC6, flagellar outer arm [Clonorchis sinensis]|uniref:Dynein light chain n=2 Tax=Clonorchis sinensis TaxID=79923 RepID=G7YE60_CLOSI|nr:Dynein light chain LC6, flagellar outer arm [Clonorchis sinensis]GAA51243.1 dynein light chain LC8-type [Clonorchis sinensis]